MRGARVVVAVVLVVAGCRRPQRTKTLERGGVSVVQTQNGWTTLRAGTLTAKRAGDVDGDSIASLRLDAGPNEGPIVETITIDGKRATVDRGRLEERDGVAALVQTIVGAGKGAEIVTTMAPTPTPILVQHVRIPAGKKARWALSRARFAATRFSNTQAITLATDPIPPTPTWSVAIDDATADATGLFVGSNDGLVAHGDPNAISIDVSMQKTAFGIEGSVELAALGKDVPIPALEVASPARVPGARLYLHARDANGRFVRARVLVEGPPIAVIDPLRNVEPHAPIYDATTDDAMIVVPAGKYVLRATHGIGWSIARTEIDVKDGDLLDVPLALSEEIPTPSFVGCDFHVHAHGSFDAPDVTYEDRVRSLVAVGVECAAATEHNHVGDHGPAALELHLDGVFRALTGVELTTKQPLFGHFNVYPWPKGEEIPRTEETTPDAMFDAVHAMKKPGAADFVFQLNHPRMRNGDDTSIGYLDLAQVDPKTGIGKGPIVYRRDYDTIEVYNGYNLSNADKVVDMIEEWTRMLDRGDVHVATGSSDSHNISYPWAGFPRTLVDVGASWHDEGRPIDAIVAALKKGKAIVTSGPIVDLRIGGAGLGDSVKSSGSMAHVVVRVTSWLGAPKLRLLLGDSDLPSVTLSKQNDGSFVADVPLPSVDRKRSLVALVEAPVVGDGAWISGMKTSLAVTNPIWLTP